MSSQTLRSSQPAFTAASRDMLPPAPTGTGRFRRAVTKFKAFDDDDEEEQTSINMSSVSQASNPTPVVESHSQSLFVSQESEMDVDREPQSKSTQPKSSKKRNTPPVDYDMVDNIDSLLPTAAKRKKQRLADEAARRERGESIPTAPEPVVVEKPVPKAKPKKAKEVDVAEEMRKNREKADERAREERESMTQQLNGMSMEEMNNLAKIEVMDVRRRSAPVRTTRADESTDWDDAWNGRKNFKKFRRRGATDGPRERGRVIVPLELYKNKDYGFGLRL